MIRKRYSILGLCLLIIALAGTNESVAQVWKEQGRTINPKIEVNFTNVSKKQEILYYTTDILGIQIRERIKITKDNPSFIIDFDNLLPYQEIWIVLGKRKGFNILALSDLVINIDLEKAKRSVDYKSFINNAVEFVGTHSEVNKLYFYYTLFQDSASYSLSWLPKEIKELNTPDRINEIRKIQQQVSNLSEKFIERYPSNYSWLIEDECHTYIERLFLEPLRDQKLNDSLWSEVYNTVPKTFTGNVNSFYYYLHLHLTNQVRNATEPNWESLIINNRNETLDQFLSRFDVELDYNLLSNIQESIKYILLLKEVLPYELHDLLMLKTESMFAKASYLIFQYVYEELDSPAFKEIQKKRIDELLMRKEDKIFSSK